MKLEDDIEDNSGKRYERSRLTIWDGRKSKWIEKKNPCGRPLQTIY